VIKTKQNCIFIIKDGNKILVEHHEDNNYRLPSIKNGSSPYSISEIESKFRGKYALEVIGTKKVFSYEETVGYTAYIPHKLEQDYAHSQKWITIKTALNYDFPNVDTLILREYLESLQATDIKLQYGVRDGKILHISELSDNDRGLACSCICPACKVDLQARLGYGKRRPHFSHNNEACNISDAQQTALHLLAKEILTENNHIMLPAYVIDGSEGDNVDYDLSDYDAIEKQLDSLEYSKQSNYQFDNVILEKKISDMIPDILIWRSSNGKKLIIEIAVTHFVDDVKKAKIIEQGISALEIDISQFHNQDFERNILQEIIIDSIDSKKWIYNTHYEKALLKLAERNNDIVTRAKKEEAARRLQREKLVKEQREKALKKEKKEQIKIENVMNSLKKENYRVIVNQLRNDELTNNHFKKKKFYSSMDKEIPFFLDIPVTGQIAFTCDRRIWQMEIFERFIYYRKENSNISIIRIWKWFTQHATTKLLNWDFITKNNLSIGNKIYADNLALGAIKQYLSYLGELGFVEYYGGFRYGEDYAVISKKIVPPNEMAAEKLEIVFNSIEDDVPTIDSDVEEFYSYLLS
jgi:hypothetical protein